MYTTPEANGMYWTNATLKKRARDNMRGRMKQYFGIGLLFTAISQLVGTVFELLELPGLTDVFTWLQIKALYPTLEQLMSVPGMDPALLQEYQAMMDFTMTGSELITGCITGVVNLLLSLLVVNVLSVGYNRWLMEARGGEPGVSSLFSVFDGAAQWGGIAWVQLGIQVRTFLWTLLFIIPGIVFSYKTCMVPFLLAENPYMTTKRAIQLSTAMTQGEKFRIFCLEFSFVGWVMLMGIAVSATTLILPVLGIAVSLVGTVLLNSYIYATIAELYACLREKAFRNGYADSRELGGFSAL